MRVVPRRSKDHPTPGSTVPGHGPVRTGLVVALAAVMLLAGALGALLASWPSARIAADPAALARVELAPRGEQVTAVKVVDDTGKPVRIVLHAGGRIDPLGTIPAGARLRVQATIHRSRWIGWLVGDTEHVQAVVRTPATVVKTRFVYPAGGKPVRVGFTSPVRVVSLLATDGSRQRLTFVRPRRTVSIGVVASGPEIAGSVLVAAAARPWERLPQAARVNWFPPGPDPQVIVRPAQKTALVPSAPIVLTFSRPVADVLGADRPRLSPRVPGAWRQPNDNTLVFQPSGLGFPLGGHVHLRLPRTVQVIAGADPAPFRTLSWPVPGGSILRLKELLAELGYLPLTFQPARSELALTPAAQARAAVDPPVGDFTWRYAKTPAALKSIWASDTERPVLLRGAVMAFQSTHGLPVDGYPGAAVWKALLHDVLTGRTARGGYSYVFVTESLPQTLTLWHNGRVVLRTAVNTGIASRPTALGTYPVYAHLTSTTMSGINPDGTPYHDPGVPWVNYFNGGDAVHGFVRPGYGYPQSLGCVEVPISTAGVIFPYVQLGTLVTVAA
jgi:hypothetical protein